MTDRPTRRRRSLRNMPSGCPTCGSCGATIAASRRVGPGVIEAFYAGLDQVRLEDFDYLCKLDMDLDLPARYFELLMERMESNPRIGTTSGKPWFVHPQSGALVPEVCGDEMSVGMTKFYRVACFKEIGGFVRQVMWDGIDCHRARMLGWIAESVDLEADPLRPSAPARRQPQGHLDRAGSGRLRPIFHGDLAALLSGGGPLPPAGAPDADRQHRHAVGLSRKLAQAACRAMTTSSSGASSAPTSTHACASENGRATARVEARAVPPLARAPRAPDSQGCIGRCAKTAPN